MKNPLVRERASDLVVAAGDRIPVSKTGWHLGSVPQVAGLGLSEPLVMPWLSYEVLIPIPTWW
jgi:hypothetical protein